MNAIDAPAHLAKLTVDLQHIRSPLRLTLQIEVCVHQMPRIQHKARIGIVHVLEQQRSKMWLTEGQPRPPEIFKEESASLRKLGNNLIDKLDRRTNDILIQRRKLPLIHLGGAIVSNMKDKIVRPAFCRLPQILLPRLHPVGDMQRAIAGTDILLAAELLQERRAIPAPKIQPRRPEQEMHALDEILGVHLAIPRSATHKLDAVQPMFAQDGRKRLRIVLKQVLHITVCVG